MDGDTSSGVVTQPGEVPELAHYSPLEELEPVTAPAGTTNQEDHTPGQDGEWSPTPRSHPLCRVASRAEKLECMPSGQSAETWCSIQKQRVRWFRAIISCPLTMNGGIPLRHFLLKVVSSRVLIQTIPGNGHQDTKTTTGVTPCQLQNLVGTLLNSHSE